MPTDKDILNKGIKYLLFALPLIFTGPVIIYNAFMNSQTNWHYLVLAVGIIFCFSAVVLMFKGISTIVNSMTD